MRKFLISLEKDQQRRALFFSQAGSQDFEVFNAINTMSDAEEKLSKRFDFAHFLQKYQRTVTKGEIGCSLSHLAVYHQIAEDNSLKDEDYCLICEDDALFHPSFQQGLEALLAKPNQADIIWLGQSKIADFNHWELEINYPTALTNKLNGSGFSIGYPYKNYYAGTVAYLIRKSAAKVFIQASKSSLPYWLADDFILFGEKLGLDIQLIRPLMVIENPKINSNLEGVRGSVAHHFWQKLLKYPAKKLLAIQRNLRKA